MSGGLNDCMVDDEVRRRYEGKKAMGKRMLELSVILSTVNHLKKLNDESSEK